VHDLKDQIHSLFETGLIPVTADDIARRDRTVTTPFPAKACRAVTVRRVTTATIAVAAAGCAAALVAVQAASPLPPATSPNPSTSPNWSHASAPWTAVRTAAYIRHVAAASRLALARSGQADITSTMTEDHRQSISTWHLTYSGANWSESFTYGGTVHGAMQLLVTGTSRVVDGQEYDYHGRAWYHVTGPHAVTNPQIADPKTLLAELAPSARFVRVGTAVVDGVPVEHLQATALDSLPVIPVLYFYKLQPQPYGHITALDVWVDDHDVVRRLAWSSDSPSWFDMQGGPVSPGHPVQCSAGVPNPACKVISYGGHIYESTVVTFSAIGQPQVITAPANPIPTRSELIHPG
jgi:hypothetical protein